MRASQYDIYGALISKMDINLTYMTPYYRAFRIKAFGTHP